MPTRIEEMLQQLANLVDTGGLKVNVVDGEISLTAGDITIDLTDTNALLTDIQTELEKMTVGTEGETVIKKLADILTATGTLHDDLDTTLHGDITDVETAVGAVTTAVEALDTNVQAMALVIDTINGLLDDIKAAVEATQAAVEAANVGFAVTDDGSASVTTGNASETFAADTFILMTCTSNLLYCVGVAGTIAWEEGDANGMLLAAGSTVRIKIPSGYKILVKNATLYYSKLA